MSFPLTTFQKITFFRYFFVFCPRISLNSFKIGPSSKKLAQYFWNYAFKWVFHLLPFKKLLFSGTFLFFTRWSVKIDRGLFSSTINTINTDVVNNNFFSSMTDVIMKFSLVSLLFFYLFFLIMLSLSSLFWGQWLNWCLDALLRNRKISNFNSWS